MESMVIYYLLHSLIKTYRLLPQVFFILFSKIKHASVVIRKNPLIQRVISCMKNTPRFTGGIRGGVF